ncbi:hypothetical protein T484DRAFT_3145530 [Baffinella frigidus]|nr:hypothetical protein T484DRAFT_3145530 [Cryptophyta sp. CCMP2293]
MALTLPEDVTHPGNSCPAHPCGRRGGGGSINTNTPNTHSINTNTPGHTYSINTNTPGHTCGINTSRYLYGPTRAPVSGLG